jgi:hypothetical protein
VSVHGTNALTLYGNVGFNIPGHCYYLEDGVEERNVLEANLAAYVVPINTTGSGGGQQVGSSWCHRGSCCWHTRQHVTCCQKSAGFIAWAALLVVHNQPETDLVLCPHLLCCSAVSGHGPLGGRGPV